MLVTNPRLGKDALIGQLPADVLRQILTRLDERIVCTLKCGSVLLQTFFLQQVREDELPIMPLSRFVLIDAKHQIYHDLKITFTGAVHNLQAEHFAMGLAKVAPAVRSLKHDKGGERVGKVIKCYQYIFEDKKEVSFVRLTHPDWPSDKPLFYIKFTTDVSAVMGDPDFPKRV